MKHFLLFSALVIACITAVAQPCSIDPNATKYGLTPDSATGIPAATVNTLYTQDVTIIIPADTMVDIGGSPTQATIDSVVLEKIAGLPSWMSVACSNSSCGFAGGDTGCAVMFGTPPPSAVGSYPLDIIATTYAKISGFPVQQTDTSYGYYTLVINPAAGITEADKPDIVIFAAYSGLVSLNIAGAAPREANWQLVDMVGRTLASGNLASPFGMVNLVDLTDFPSGIYLVHVESEDDELVKKISWSGN